MDPYAPYFAAPTVVLTTDVEWAPEWAIRDLYALADAHGVPVTPFLTHRSAFLAARLAADGAARRDAGVHPNFLPGSTHGSSPDEVIAAVRALAPEATSFRSHCFYDDTRTLRLLAARGFRYDSNALAFLQPLIAPLVTAAGTLRFPVWWEDDVHSAFGLPWDIAALAPALEAPGLKIVNVHPLRVALNVPDETFYEGNRALYGLADADASAHAYEGRGTRTLLAELLAGAASTGRVPRRLREVYDDACERGIGVSIVS